MTHPAFVTAPRDRLEPGSLEIIHISPDGWWSIAKMLWRGVPGGPPEPAVGMRWNGRLDDRKDRGNPIANFQPTWTILPHPLAAAALAHVIIYGPGLANEPIPEQKAA